MRKLMWFTLGIGAACALCVYLWLTENLLLPILLAAAMLALSLCLYRRVKWMRCVIVLCMGFIAGLLWFRFYSCIYLSVAAQLDEKETEITVCCTDYSYETSYGTAVEGTILRDGKIVRVKAYLKGKLHLQPGDEVEGLFRCRVTTPDGGDEPTAHQGKGIFLLVTQVGELQIRKPDQMPRWTYPSRIRHRLQEILDCSFPEDTAAFSKALLLGDRTGIDYQTNTALKLSGISHVIAVSGLHVTILFTLISMLAFKRRWLVALLGIPTLLLFAAVAGFSPSITRACIMQCLMVLAALLDKEYDGPTELAFSCLVMLLVNPLVITSVSFQLSVGCMIGIFLFNHRISEYLAGKLMGKNKRFLKVKQWLITSVSVTLSAMVMTTPLVALYFGAVSLIGVLTNLLTLWVISFIFYGIILVCLLDTFWTAAAAIVASIVSWPIRYVLGISKMLSSFPLSAVYTASIYIVLWLGFCYLLLGVFLLGKTKKPVILFCCAVIGLCLSLGASWLEPLTDHCRITVLDVGQGQCILLQSEGKTYLVDCGGSNAEEAADLAAETILSQGIKRLDGVVVTHFDADHAGGLELLLPRIPTQMLIVPACIDERAVFERLQPYAEQTVVVQENIQLTYGTTELSIFGPVMPDSGNESSLALLFRRDNCDILITGDRTGFGERMLLRSANIPEVDILVAGHHGSKNSTCEELLLAVRPKTVVVSVGENSYGHPAKEMLDRVAAIGSEIYRTDLYGTIIFRR